MKMFSVDLKSVVFSCFLVGLAFVSMAPNCGAVNAQEPVEPNVEVYSVLGHHSFDFESVGGGGIFEPFLTPIDSYEVQTFRAMEEAKQDAYNKVALWVTAELIKVAAGQAEMFTFEIVNETSHGIFNTPEAVVLALPHDPTHYYHAYYGLTVQVTRISGGE